MAGSHVSFLLDFCLGLVQRRGKGLIDVGCARRTAMHCVDVAFSFGNATLDYAVDCGQCRRDHAARVERVLQPLSDVYAGRGSAFCCVRYYVLFYNI